ncbi:FYN-binding protein 1 isoform X2 [Genypterus blacodes]|uniref:FYN-binding protein 1 isoform X2 n=1 Tax=Genypterus blacodes TaxID=154954 RepID=UPI003F7734FF
MDNKADVKSIMARFQTGGTNTEEVSSTPAGRPKPPLHPTLSSGPTILKKKPVLESLSGSAITIPPKPTYLKSTISSKSDTEVQESHRNKAPMNRFANTHNEINSNSKPFVNKQHIKPPLHKPSLSATLPDSKPFLPKPSSGSSPKPSWMKEESNPSATPPKMPALQQKPSSTIAKFIKQNEETAQGNTDAPNKPFPPVSSPFKPQTNFRTAQHAFNKEAEQSDSGGKGEGAGKPSFSASNSVPPPMPPVSKKPSFVRRSVGPSSQTSSNNDDDASAPKRKPLPNNLALGPPPAKPNRPPMVNLEGFRQAAEKIDQGPSAAKKAFIKPPVLPHPSNHNNHLTSAQPPQPPVPSLPPRHPSAIIQPDTDENYDDVGLINPPPLPPSTGHPSQRAKEADDSDGEMYEDLDDHWDHKDQEKKKEQEKEEKKRLEAERKEQKEREKKENDIKKRFKLVGPMVVIHQGKACVDSKGSKMDLALKQGDSVDIIRVQGNPEAKWLGRTQDGSVGYVKTTSVEIDFDTLKHQGESCRAQQAHEPEVYDDIDTTSHDNFNSGFKGPGVVLPPPPDEDGEIYDDIVDLSLDVRIPPPSQFTAEGNSDKPAVIDEEIYDDVDSQACPPLPPISSMPTKKGRSRTEEMDPKRQKKLEKEEKEFRKKFKYDGEIQVLYEVTIIPTLTIKKFSGKDLPVKPGERLDVIVKAVDDKLICQNEEGKFGYVSTGHIVMEDSEIYDDIGDDCIYDND